MQFRSRLGDHPALIARACEFVLARLAAAIAVGDGGCAVGRATSNLLDAHLACEAVIETHDRHAEVQKIGDDREQRGFLAAMLGRAR